MPQGAEDAGKGRTVSEQINILFTKKECAALTLLVQATTGPLMEKMKKRPDDSSQFTDREIALIRAMDAASGPYVELVKIGEAWAEKRVN